MLSQSFDRGQTKDFFKAWHQLVPNKMIASDFQTKKLEFYLHVYFVIYVFHPHNNQGARERSLESLKVEQAEFKKYLDNAGSELSKTSEFLAFYALPYVPNPTDHPSFKSLFSMDWVNQLKSQLKGFVHERAFELGLPHLGQNSS